MKRQSHLLKDDSKSVERREWYTTLQGKFYQNYENFVQLQAAAKEEEEVGSSTLSYNRKPQDTTALMSDLEAVISRSPSLVCMTPSDLVVESPIVALCFHGMFTNHSMFGDLSKTLQMNYSMSMFSICLPSRMHRLNDPLLPSLRHIVYSLYEEWLEFLSLLVTSPLKKKILFIGYDIGCFIGYELIRLLLSNRKDRFSADDFAGFITISSRTPLLQSRWNIDIEGHNFHYNELNDSHFIQNMIELEGIPPAMCERKDLLRKFIPLFRYDFQLLETYIIEPPHLPGQPRSLAQISEEYRSSWYYTYKDHLTTEYLTMMRKKGDETLGDSIFGYSKRNPAKRSISSSSSSSFATRYGEKPTRAVDRKTESKGKEKIAAEGKERSPSPNQRRSSTKATPSSHLKDNKKKIDKVLTTFQNQTNDLLDMPISLYRVPVPIISIAVKNDKLFPNDEEIKKWSSFTSIFHRHYLLENESLTHYHLNSNETVSTLKEIIQRLISGASFVES
jgi:surfactin synthase thioesterase subunit